MDVDLTGRLLRRSVPTAGDVAEPLLREGGEGSARAPWQGRQAQMQRAAAARGPAAGAYPRMPPRRGEAARWERSKKFAKRVSTPGAAIRAVPGGRHPRPPLSQIVPEQMLAHDSLVMRSCTAITSTHGR